MDHHHDDESEHGHHDHDHDDDEHGAHEGGAGGAGGAGGGEGDEFDPDPIYESFPSGESRGFGTDQGFNEFKKLNDPELFTDDARRDPVIRAFLEAPFSVTYVQFKSSTRESEWAIHKPHLILDRDAALERPEAVGLDQTVIEGKVDRYPGPDAAHISTFVVNHDVTLARLKQSVIVMENGAQAGQMIWKHPQRQDDSD
jgi:hypothetical protein